MMMGLAQLSHRCYCLFFNRYAALLGQAQFTIVRPGIFS